MSQTIAYEYEIFIRRAHQVGQKKIKAASADVYRDLERKKLRGENNDSYLNQLNDVGRYVQTAIDTAIKDYFSQLGEDRVNELKKYKTLTLKTNNITELNEAIKGADSILHSIGLYPK